MIFTAFSKLKIKTKVITVRKKVKLWLHSSIATLEAHKNESGVETKCYKYKKNPIEVIWSDFWPRAWPPQPHVLAYLSSRCSKLDLFFLMFPNVCFLISLRWKKISTKCFHHCILNARESLSLKYERNWTKLIYWKIVANEKCSAEIGELSSVKSVFWANHATKKARNSFKRKVFGWTNLSLKANWLYWVILEN